MIFGNIHVHLAIQDHHAVSTRLVDGSRNLSPIQLQQLTSATDQASERSNLLHKDFPLVCILTTGRLVTAVSLSSEKTKNVAEASPTTEDFPDNFQASNCLKDVLLFFGC